MSKQHDSQAQQRRQAALRYIDALKHGDLAAVAAALSEAEYDPTLESLLLEANRLFQKRDGIAVPNDELLQARRFLSALQDEARIGTTYEDLSSDNGTYAAAGSVNGTFHERRLQSMQIETPSTLSNNTVPKREATPHKARFPRAARFMQMAAAVLIVGALITSFLYVFSMHHNAPRQVTQTGAPPASPPGIYINRSDGVYRLNIQTRKVIWHARIAEPPRLSASPVVIGDSVYITVGDTVFALNAQTGILRWSHDFSKIVKSLYMDDGLLYVNTVLIQNTVLYAVNPEVGKIVATYTPIQGQKFWTSTVVVHGVLYYTTNSSLYAVYLPGEKLLWQKQINKAVMILPIGIGVQNSEGIIVQNGVVYVQVMQSAPGKLSQAGFIYAFDAHSGRQLWQSPALPALMRAVVVTDTMIYVAGIDELVALDAHTHALIWHQPLDSDDILAASDNLYVSYTPKNVDLFEIAALNATTGNLLWKSNNSNGVKIAGVLNGIIYGIDWSSDGKSGTIYALDANNGHQLWAMPTSATFQQWGGMVVA